MPGSDRARRHFLLAAAAAAATGLLPAPAGAASPVRARDVVDRIRGRVGIPWRADSVDRIVAGNAGAAVTGIATTMVASLDMLRRAAAAGANMVVTHETTFYSHFDTVDTLGDDATHAAKRDFITGHDMVVFRFHDHWHAMAPDGIGHGMARALGWTAQADPRRPGEFVLDACSLGGVATHLSKRLAPAAMRILGDPATRVRRVAAFWGYADLERTRAVAARPDVDLVVVGETREWELVPYVEDQIAAGANKALVVLGHVASEQAGMAWCAEWLRGFIDEVPVQFIAADEPLRAWGVASR